MTLFQYDYMMQIKVLSPHPPLPPPPPPPPASLNFCCCPPAAFAKNSTMLRIYKKFIYQLLWTQACPEGMCTNGTKVPCEVPSLPNPTTRKGWPHHRGL